MFRITKVHAAFAKNFKLDSLSNAKVTQTTCKESKVLRALECFTLFIADLNLEESLLVIFLRRSGRKDEASSIAKMKSKPLEARMKRRSPGKFKEA